jgi:hypothetical protein
MAKYPLQFQTQFVEFSLSFFSSYNYAKTLKILKPLISKIIHIILIGMMSSVSIASDLDSIVSASPNMLTKSTQHFDILNQTKAARGLQVTSKTNHLSCAPPAFIFNSPSDPNNIDGTGSRWCIPGDGTVIDLLTGLVWMRDLGALGDLPWIGCQISACTIAGSTGKTAVGILAELENGFPININGNQTTLTDGSVSGDWRAPTVLEAEFLNSPGVVENLSGNHPFYRIPFQVWTSSHTVNDLGSSLSGASSLYYLTGFSIRNSTSVISLHDTLKGVVAVRSRKIPAPDAMFSDGFE